MSTVLSEITALSQRDCFYIVERHKSQFTYPLHQHREYELNFIQNGQGLRRIVGDSVELIPSLDLVLISGENLEHVWEQSDCTSEDIREITIQFSPDLFSGELLGKNQFARIAKMLERATHGIAFPTETIMKAYHRLDTLASEKDSFNQFISCLQLLYELSGSPYRILASSSFAHAPRDRESRRVLKVKEYINEHFAEPLTLEMMASLVGMSPSAFSRFFRQHTDRTFTAYLIDIRLGQAARELVDTSQNISEICYQCGFNNLSNFNRIFKSKRGMSPREFRQIYKKKKVLV